MARYVSFALYKNSVLAQNAQKYVFFRDKGDLKQEENILAAILLPRTMYWRKLPSFENDIASLVQAMK